MLFNGEQSVEYTDDGEVGEANKLFDEAWAGCGTNGDDANDVDLAYGGYSDSSWEMKGDDFECLLLEDRVLLCKEKIEFVVIGELVADSSLSLRDSSMLLE